MKSWIATIKNKGLSFTPTTRAMFVDYLAEHEGEKVEVVARKIRKTVSQDLRGFYWGAWLPFIKGLDDNLKRYTVDELHEILKLEFNGRRLWNPVRKELSTIPQKVMQESVSTQEAFLYMEKIRRWVAENYGEEMPDAEEFNRRRDMHFEENPAKVAYPESDGEVTGF